jgi:hypothetical protein
VKVGVDYWHAFLFGGKEWQPYGKRSGNSQELTSRGHGFS